MQFTPYESNVIAALDSCNGAVKQCAKHAITHLNKAWAIREIDKEMAAFRGITAEEEAASSLFYSLKNNRYANAEKLAFKEHAHKLGLFPFLKAIGKFLGDLLEQESTPFESFKIAIVKQGKRQALELILKMRGSEMVARPQPPLHFGITDAATGHACTFEGNFTESISGENYRSAITYIKDLANQRNTILYANEKGRPIFAGDIDALLSEQKRKVFVILQIVLLSDPWHRIDGPSGFIQQALNAFLLLLERIQRDDIENSAK